MPEGLDLAAFQPHAIGNSFAAACLRVTERELAMRVIKQARLLTKGADLEQDIAWWNTKRELAENLADTAFDVPYHEELAGRDGMSFTLLPYPGQSDELVARAASWLGRQRDVVAMRYLRIEQYQPLLDRQPLAAGL
jgi:hypothetical protein